MPASRKSTAGIFKTFAFLLPALAILGWWAGGLRTTSERAPLTPAAQEIFYSSLVERGDLASLSLWVRTATPHIIVQTARDVLPNGLAMGMMPLLVDWEARPVWADGPGYLVHNVQVGGNPVRGRQVFASVWIPEGAVASVEWNMVLARVRGRETAGGHGQLRFIFSKDRRPVILAEDGTPLGQGDRLDDLVISWEAWRPPATEWTLTEGLDPDVYTLTVRAYDGAVRFLADGLRNNSWESYPLDLDGLDNGNESILRTSLMMGDALARRVFGAFVEEMHPGLKQEIAVLLPDEESYDTLRRRLAEDRVPDEPLTELMGTPETSYHALERSCITQALLAIDLGVEASRPADETGPRLEVVPRGIPGWVGEIPEAGLGQRLARLPAAAMWVVRNRTVIPGNAYELLDEAGLLTRDEDGIVKFTYRIEGATPYGPLSKNILY